MEILILFIFICFIFSMFGGSKKKSGGAASYNSNPGDQMFTCRYCGIELQATGAVSYCTHGPGHQHELIAKSEEYVCKFCGMKLQHTQARSHCVKSASKSHVLINAKPSYTCRYCGFTSNDSHFTMSYCMKGPGHQHELID